MDRWPAKSRSLDNLSRREAERRGEGEKLRRSRRLRQQQPLYWLLKRRKLRKLPPKKRLLSRFPKFRAIQACLFFLNT
jgi:hypothetical protein